MYGIDDWRYIEVVGSWIGWMEWRGCAEYEGSENLWCVEMLNLLHTLGDYV